jgi:hypothetical protein
MRTVILKTVQVYIWALVIGTLLTALLESTVHIDIDWAKTALLISGLSVIAALFGLWFITMFEDEKRRLSSQQTEEA